MAEHTPTPWALMGRGDIIGVCKGFPQKPVAKVLGQETSEERAANIDLMLKAVNNHEKLLEFFKWAMREGPWDGGDLDGGSVQDKAEALGLIVKTQYDAEKHGVQSEFEHGDDWFEYAPDIRAPLIAPRHT
ncbi:hypothetical protein IVA94_14625 [Bradyrhizobium sp. 156]|uniref:hypothetical protein n=1 Tax=Bradyrhizobium sp. 156 TaxID=2782630 RepID=UPI001FF8F807|nr:hypothetical protein [Bradyrhizobium sp. 156]MCK1322103.1 hypothetical protein [Bradyrhizobium sp. 156]